MKLLTTIATIAIILTPQTVKAQNTLYSIPTLAEVQATLSDSPYSPCADAADKLACQVKVLETYNKATEEPPKATEAECLAVVNASKMSKGDKKIYARQCSADSNTVINLITEYH